MITRLVVIHCDGKSPDCAWSNEPIQGDPNETATHLLRSSGWVTVRGKHICGDCQWHARNARRGGHREG